MNKSDEHITLLRFFNQKDKKTGRTFTTTQEPTRTMANLWVEQILCAVLYSV